MLVSTDPVEQLTIEEDWERIVEAGLIGGKY